MSWGNVIAAGITAATGRRDNLEARKAAGTANAREKEAADIAWTRQLELNETQRAFERDQAATAMQFSERMANTQHQREVADLRAAGLNPVLSGTGGMGAAAPAGVAGHSAASTAPKAGVHKAQVFQTSPTALAAVQAGAAIDKMMAETENLRADTDNKRADHPFIQGKQEAQRIVNENVQSDTRFKDAMSGKSVAEQEKILEEIKVVVANQRLIEQQIAESKSRVMLQAAQADQAYASSGRERAQMGLLESQGVVAGIDAETMMELRDANLNELLKASPLLAPMAHILGPILKRALSGSFK